MKVNILLSLIFWIFPVYSMDERPVAGYETTILIGETCNTKPLLYSLRLKEKNFANEDTGKSCAHIDRKSTDKNYQDPQINDVVKSHQCFHFYLCSHDKKDEEALSHLTFEVIDQNKIIGNIMVAWRYENNRLKFTEFSNENFLFLPFMRDLPFYKKRIHRYIEKYELGLSVRNL